MTDTDTWWHLRAGQWLVENQAFAATDPFCEYCANKPWIMYSWLYELTMYSLYSGPGLTGILLFRVILCVVNVALLYRLVAQRDPGFLLAALLTAVAALAMLPLMTERPWLLSILFSLLTLDAVLAVREGRASRKIWLLPLAYVIWANTHIQFVCGFFLLAAGCAAPVIDWLISGRTRDSQLRHAVSTFSAWKQLLALTAACVFATLLNPYHVRLYQVVLEYATQTAPLFLIRELMALEFRAAWEWAALALALFSAFCLGRKQNLSSFDVLLLAGAAYFTFHSRRDVWLMALAAAVVIPGRNEKTDGDIDRHSMLRLRFALRPGRIVLTAICVGVLAFGIAAAKNLSEEHLEQAVAQSYPKQAIAVLLERNDPGPLFNDFGWGGYLLWAAPGHKASIDGRANLHGEQRVQRSFDTWAGLPGWDRDPELTAANVVLANKTTALAAQLRTDPHFQLVFEDELALLLVRVPPVPPLTAKQQESTSHAGK